MLSNIIDIITFIRLELAFIILYFYNLFNSFFLLIFYFDSEKWCMLDKNFQEKGVTSIYHWKKSGSLLS